MTDKAAKRVEHLHAAVGKGGNARNAWEHINKQFMVRQSELLDRLYDSEPNTMGLSDYRCIHVQIQEQKNIVDFYEKIIRDGERAQSDLERVTDKGA